MATTNQQLCYDVLLCVRACIKKRGKFDCIQNSQIDSVYHMELDQHKF